MCVIIAKSKTGVNPTINEIKAALATNPDGSAIVWCNNGTLETFKTMNNEEMAKYYAEHFEVLKNTSFVFHARIATHGSLGIKNCHGWSTLNGHAAFFHNGVLNIKNRGDMTDSETFLRDIYEPIANKGGHKAAINAIKAVIGSSKFAFIGDTGEIKLYGNFNKREGFYTSNNNHLWRMYRTPRHQSYIDRLESGFFF